MTSGMFDLNKDTPLNLGLCVVGNGYAGGLKKDL